MSNEANTVKEIRANRFVLEDKNGNKCAALTMDKDGPTLSLEKDKHCAALTVDNEGVQLLLTEKGDMSAGLSVGVEGTPSGCKPQLCDFLD